jgi:hypothetical protein
MDLDDASVKQMLHDLDVTMTRVQAAILKRYNWKSEKTWGFGASAAAE